MALTPLRARIDTPEAALEAMGKLTMATRSGSPERQAAIAPVARRHRVHRAAGI